MCIRDSFAALVPLRVYPSESVPCKDPCIADRGKEGNPNRTAVTKSLAAGDRGMGEI